MIMGRLFDRKGLKAGILFGALGICGSYFLMALSVFWSSAWFLVVIALFYGDHCGPKPCIISQRLYIGGNMIQRAPNK